MALTAFQRDVCRVLAERRRAGGESYVAGGIALNVALATHRLSRDLDLFHDTTEAVARSWDADRQLLEHTGYAVVSVRERPGFVQATVSRGHDRLLVEWVLQPLGYLAWAGCGKDPGFSPLGVIDHARRSSHYSTDEIASLAFDGPPPNPADLSRRWSRALETSPPLR